MKRNFIRALLAVALAGLLSSGCGRADPPNELHLVPEEQDKIVINLFTSIESSLSLIHIYSHRGSGGCVGGLYLALSHFPLPAGRERHLAGQRQHDLFRDRQRPDGAPVPGAVAAVDHCGRGDRGHVGPEMCIRDSL